MLVLVTGEFRSTVCDDTHPSFSASSQMHPLLLTQLLVSFSSLRLICSTQISLGTLLECDELNRGYTVNENWPLLPLQLSAVYWLFHECCIFMSNFPFCLTLIGLGSQGTCPCSSNNCYFLL